MDYGSSKKLGASVIVAYVSYRKVVRCPKGACLDSKGYIYVSKASRHFGPVPYGLIHGKVFCRLSSCGGRLIISSDGVWDALSAESTLQCSRGMQPDAAASQIVKEAVGVKGLKDDTTCIVVDLQALEKSPLAPPKKQGISVFKSMFRRKSSESPLSVEKYYNEPDEVEELVHVEMNGWLDIAV
ncbi:hypothetical protein POM88_034773 [Heracleum sosnowskyi]|uniref:PPM-type phosphatase domain-containing protein n=1 Tax=Heracleum sosnowskyi TaxID=360622 RepID=A0AAD8HL72_9APIA|nr:hypothetical protein POM88_034773 [Heracleum sosnowskyi]